MTATTLPLHVVSASPMSGPGTMMESMAPDTRTTPLVGRDDELSQLSVVLGSTRHSAAQGRRGIVGHCLDFGDSALPYLPFTEIFGRLLAESPVSTPAEN